MNRRLAHLIMGEGTDLTAHQLSQALNCLPPDAMIVGGGCQEREGTFALRVWSGTFPEVEMYNELPRLYIGIDEELQKVYLHSEIRKETSHGCR